MDIMELAAIGELVGGMGGHLEAVEQVLNRKGWIGSSRSHSGFAFPRYARADRASND